MHDAAPVCLRVPDLLPVEHAAIKACLAGSADAAQARMAMEVIVQKICRTHDLAYIPESERDSAFMSGRQFVGYTVLSFLKKAVPEEKRDA